MKSIQLRYVIKSHDELGAEMEIINAVMNAGHTDIRKDVKCFCNESSFATIMLSCLTT